MFRPLTIRTRLADNQLLHLGLFLAGFFLATPVSPEAR